MSRLFYRDPAGIVYEYESVELRNQYGAPDLVQLTPAEVEAHLNPPVVPIVPAKVTMRQARLALLGAGLLDDVEAALAAMGDTPEGKAARIEWDYSSEVFRHKPFVVQLGTALDLTTEQVDGLFITASGID